MTKGGKDGENTELHFCQPFMAVFVPVLPIHRFFFGLHQRAPSPPAPEQNCELLLLRTGNDGNFRLHEPDRRSQVRRSGPPVSVPKRKNAESADPRHPTERAGGFPNGGEGEMEAEAQPEHLGGWSC